MDMEALKTYITAIDEKSFTKASEVLNLSQPTVSAHIKNLERFFQTTLIDRSPKHFQVTPTGEFVYRRARQVLGLLEKAHQEVKQYHEEVGGSIYIGASYTVGEYIIPSLLKKFDEKYPAIDLQVRIANSERINREVQQHELDLGLVEGKVTEQGLRSFPFMEDEMVIIVPREHPLRHGDGITFDRLQDHTWITREGGSGTRAMLDSMLVSSNIRPRKMITIGSNHGVVQGVKEGLGISFISKTVVEHTDAEDLIMQLPYIRATARYFSIVTPINEEEITENVRVFIEHVRGLYKLSQNH
ncbi:DNA-binding transcriptional regulator, LysR family [Halobacillus karajensis]|uniref:CysJI operon transcriptional activator n=2 Tax=Halobacillus karajensis TaxID=195088 RepID=A0A024P9J2_9BACI|nr:LysR family transcriptional regulator [Halobacillus karajensis]CDQ21593.1 CysJI operon transcriptional activator [Halobacillus karajensis]CDQ25528.1 CysJI operon transcriptional activator [Halobacillus karajensis]CDQ28942.1 CysJI operon transcriptional activator [Halobacillus karajensis]SEI08678.1 DNA-binding transcriptional regulator, LysR family [Halobacillus karajensis]